MTALRTATPYGLASAVERPVEATKRELLGLVRRCELAALDAPPSHMAATLQDVRYLTVRTRAVYTALAGAGVQIRLHAIGLHSWLGPGVTGIGLADDDPLVDEWTVVLPGARPQLFTATDLGRTGCTDDDRCFSYAVSQDPELVTACAQALGLPPE